MRIVQSAALMLLVVMTACVSGRPAQDSYTSPTTGKTTVIESDREMCNSSCDADYTRCMEAEPAEKGIPGTPPGMFGAAAECRDELSSCLPGCKSR